MTTDYKPPTVLPACWQPMDPIPQLPGILVYQRNNGLRVLLGLEDHAKGSLWLHVSFSRAMRLPGWDDLREVKDLFIGRDRVAVQILPRESQYVNFHRYTLHLWSRLDGPTLAGTHPEEA